MPTLEIFLVFSLLLIGIWLYTFIRILQDGALDKTNKIIWVVAITVVPMIGCILYFVLPDRQIKV